MNMKVKAVDIARELGISKATVSLALNEKPGVNENTRRQILECKMRLESGKGSDELKEIQKMGSLHGYVIKIIVAHWEIGEIKGGELDLWTDVNVVFDQIAKSWGCMVELIYYNMSTETNEIVVRECNQDKVAGVIIVGTELKPENSGLFEDIKKPKVIYDGDLKSSKYPCVMVNNHDGIEKAIQHFIENGKKEIVYLHRSIEIYNYTSRREAFTNTMRKYNLYHSNEEQMVVVGKSINEIAERLGVYIDTHKLPEAFLAESYHVSIALLKVFRERGIIPGKDVSIIGVDELPDYLLGECQLTTVRIPHTERAKWTMQLLRNEICDPCSMKSKIYTNCKLILGKTV